MVTGFNAGLSLNETKGGYLCKLSETLADFLRLL